MDKEILRKVQLVQLEMAKEIKRVCEANNIKYFLAAGTLLGAIRHKGFIPWDDDLDIGMMRNEYERFIEVCSTQLSDKYYLQSWDDDSDYTMEFSKLKKKGTVYIEKNMQYSNFGKEIYIDIFPYDTYPDDEKCRKKQARKLKVLRRLLLVKARVYPWLSCKSVLEREAKHIKYIPFLICSKFFSAKSLISIMKRISNAYNNQDSKYVAPQGGATDWGQLIISRECFKTYTDVLFEKEHFMAPGNCDLYLKEVYGDYMTLPPEDQRENRHNIIKIKL